jgi:acyl-CoA reductase-like NAD-dependent aldehyde dehydrogenase
MTDHPTSEAATAAGHPPGSTPSATTRLARPTGSIINPATGERIGSSALDTVDGVKAAIARAKAAQPAWAALPLRERVRCIRRLRDTIVARADQLADVIARDNGKVRVDALSAEIVPAALAASYYAKKARAFLAPRKTGTGNLFLFFKRGRIVRHPFGVIGIISPWNYPFAIPFSEVVTALLAGNAVVLKTASETQLVGRALEECVRAAGLPQDVFRYVNLPGKLAGNAFLEGGVDKLFFTGSTAVGKTLMRKASETLTPLVLELGGNDPMIVLEDADLDRAAAGAVWAGMSNSGQSCGAAERIYVQERVYNKFLDLLKAKVEALRVGPDRDFESDMGCMTTERQIETVELHIKDALGRGAVIFAKSGVSPEAAGLLNYLPAMVLTNVNHDMLLMREETFGPVVGVMKFAIEDEAVALANDSPLGLTASVWSRNRRRAAAVATRLKAGAVTINDHLMSHGLAETPWGGFKESGIGWTHGRLGFDEMTHAQVVVRDLLPFVKKDLWWPPYGKKLYAGLRGILDAQYGKGLGRRARGLGRVLRIFPRMFKK